MEEVRKTQSGGFYVTEKIAPLNVEAEPHLVKPCLDKPLKSSLPKSYSPPRLDSTCSQWPSSPEYYVR